MKNNRLLVMYVYVVLVLAALPIMSGCPKAAAAPITLRYAHVLPATELAPFMEWFSNQIEQRTNGRVKIVHYYSGSLAPAEDILEAVRSGLADMGDVFATYHPGKTPLWNMGTLPYCTGDYYTSMLVARELFDSEPAMQAEVAAFNQKFLFPEACPDTTLYTTFKITSMADLKGKKMRSFGGYSTLLEDLGAVTLFMPVGDVYASLQKGTIDGGLTVFTSIESFKFHEVAKYILLENLGIDWSSYASINLGVWNKLPPDVQKVFEEVSQEYAAKSSELVQDMIEKQTKVMEDAGVEFTKLTPEESERWREKAKPLWEDWIKEMEAKGLPGEKIFDDYRQILAKHGVVIRR